jgi:hypothetical protein
MMNIKIKKKPTLRRPKKMKHKVVEEYIYREHSNT